MIIISRELDYALRISMQNILNYNQAIMLDNQELIFNYLFGIPCLRSLALEGLDFEIR